MRRAPFIGIVGGQKVGKTHLLAQIFESQYFQPEEVLYVDNHGSTDMFDLPQWTRTTRFGVKHMDPNEPADLSAELVEIKSAYARKKVAPFKATVIDDWSEYAEADIDEKQKDHGQGQMIRDWGQHGALMKDSARKLLSIPAMAHFAIFQAAQLPDPLVARTKKVEDGELKFTSDLRDTRIRPLLKGMFAAWFPYKLDALFYLHKEVTGTKIEHILEWMPTEKVEVFSRWEHHWIKDPKKKRTLVNPTFDQFWSMILSFESSEGE